MPTAEGGIEIWSFGDATISDSVLVVTLPCRRRCFSTRMRQTGAQVQVPLQKWNFDTRLAEGHINGEVRRAEHRQADRQSVVGAEQRADQSLSTASMRVRVRR